MVCVHTPTVYDTYIHFMHAFTQLKNKNIHMLTCTHTYIRTHTCIHTYIQYIHTTDKLPDPQRISPPCWSSAFGRDKNLKNNIFEIEFVWSQKDSLINLFNPLICDATIRCNRRTRARGARAHTHTRARAHTHTHTHTHLAGAIKGAA